MPPKKKKAAAAAASAEPKVPAPLDNSPVERGTTPAPQRAPALKPPNTLSAQKSTLMGPPQSGVAKHKFNESPAVQPATWLGDPMLPEWCTAIGLLLRHRTEAYQGARVIALFPKRKRKYQNGSIHRKLKVPTSVILPQPRIQD
jgi:hypothetical protein